MVLVVAILAIAAVAVTAAAASGLRVYRRAREYSVLHADLMLGLERCERDLRNAFPYAEIGFMGTRREVSFPGLVRVHTRNGEIVETPGRIRYALDEATHTFTYAQQEYGAATASQASPPGETTVLAENVETLVFTYYAYDGETEQYAWTDTWDRAAGLPRAVRLALTPATSEQGVTWTRTVFIPATHGNTP